MLKNYFKLKEILIKDQNILRGSETQLFNKIFIETISYCNSDCNFCPASTKVGAKNPANFMSEGLFFKILNELKDQPFKGSVAFHCNNEPLLDERLPSWIKKARQILKNNFFYFYTNGLLLNLELANRLFEAGLNRIIINNYDDKHELASNLKHLIDNSERIKGEIILNYRLKTEYLLNRAGQAPNARFYLKAPLKIICLRPLNEIVIGYDGTVPLCCADGLWKVVMGNVRESSLRDIWFSSFFKSTRRALAEGNRNCTKICRVCDALNFFAAKGTRK